MLWPDDLTITASSAGGELAFRRRLMDALAAAHDAAVQMIDMTIVRVHQHAACVARNKAQSMGRSLGWTDAASSMSGRHKRPSWRWVWASQAAKGP